MWGQHTPFMGTTNFQPSLIFTLLRGRSVGLGEHAGLAWVLHPSQVPHDGVPIVG